jgi:hypothetical protein
MLHRRRVLAFAVLCLMLGGAFLAAARDDAAAGHEGCVVTADGPFLYHTTVFPVTAVECDAAQGRLRIFTALTRDGVQVSSERRDCRKTSVCHLDFDASVEDIPGGQTYCLQTRGYVGGTHFVGEASRCESEPF